MVFGAVWGRPSSLPDILPEDTHETHQQLLTWVFTPDSKPKSLSSASRWICSQQPEDTLFSQNTCKKHRVLQCPGSGAGGAHLLIPHCLYPGRREVAYSQKTHWRSIFISTWTLVFQALLGSELSLSYRALGHIQWDMTRRCTSY